MTRISYAASLALSAAILASSALAAAAATEKVLWSFKSAALGEPLGRLLFHGPALFGTGSSADLGGDGQVFRLIQSGGSWKETSPVKFGGTDGANPFAGLISDSLGTFYGTTELGDAYGLGNVFYLYRSGSTWLHGTIWAFGNGSDGQFPLGDLIRDSSGNLYGTTWGGGVSGWGTVFELSFNGFDWTESIIHTFTGGGDGGNPRAGLLLRSGTLYGTASQGAGTGCGGAGCGTVFELAPNGGGWNFSTLYTFAGGSDGGQPWGSLIAGSGGALYGTTTANGAGGWGTVFNLTQSGGVWTENVLHSFTGGSDGGTPYAALLWNGSGGLYGTAAYGGNSGCFKDRGCGTVFELTQSGGVWSETVLWNFGGSGDGGNPQGGVILDKSGNLYGTATRGGTYANGAVWEVTP
jgi:hypothetical protein